MTTTNIETAWLSMTDAEKRAFYEANPEYQDPYAAQTAQRSKRHAPKESQTYWWYARAPVAVLHDRELSAHAKVIAFAIAAGINAGAWNTEARVKTSYSKLAELASVSRSTAIRAVAELRDADYLEVTALGGRAGVSLRFGDRCRRDADDA